MAVGPNTSIGDRCRLSDAAVEDSIIMEGAEVHGWRVRNSLLGREQAPRHRTVGVRRDDAGREIGDPRRVIVVTGAGGQLGTAFRKLIPDAVFLTRADLDLSHPEGVHQKLNEIRPDTVINCAAYTAVDRRGGDRPGSDGQRRCRRGIGPVGRR